MLPQRATAADFHTDGSTNTVKKILAAWPLPKVQAFFENDLGVPLALEAESGKFFPVSNQARTVLDALINAATGRGVQLRLGARVNSLVRADGDWLVGLPSGEVLRASAVVLATGGLSVPATGSEGTGLNIARGLGHFVVPTYPALTPLTTSSPVHKAMAGLSLVATVSVPQGDGKGLFVQRGGFLFTHKGYSGPAVLNVSHIPVRSTFVGGPRPSAWVQWSDLNAGAWDELLRDARGFVAALLRLHVPERLGAMLLQELQLTGVTADQLRREDRQRLVDALTRYALPWSGHEGYRVAEVTGGGISLAEVVPATLESRIAPGLFLCGEMLDAFGPIGGYNFHWAWVTGKIAGVGAALAAAQAAGR